MPGIYCTVEGCWDSKESKHRFPNSNIYPELFRKWLDLCNKKALFDLPPNLVYSNYRVCRLHFAEEDFGRNNRLLKTAYPKLRLPVRVETSLRQVEVQEGVNIDAPSTSNVLKPSTSTQTLNNFDLPTTSGNMCDPQTPVKSTYKMDPYFGSLRMMPKINDTHANPQKIYKMKVSSCTQALSRTVAVAINVMALSGTVVNIDGECFQLDKSAVDTAKCFEFFDNLFDSLNSVGMAIKELRRPVEDNSKHITFWQEAILLLKKMKFVTKSGKEFTPPTLTNFIKTVENFIQLYSLLKSYGFKKMKTRNCNQDCLENFFAQVRSRGIRYVNPTCEAFTPFYKSLLINNLSMKHAPGRNCQDDKTEMFVTLKTFLTAVILASGPSGPR